MRPADRAGPRRWLLVPAAVLVLSGLAAGCSSSTPAYCTAAANLKTSSAWDGEVELGDDGAGGPDRLDREGCSAGRPCAAAPRR